MLFMLNMHMSPEAWENLSEEDRNSMGDGHAKFISTVRESGEMVVTYAVKDPSESTVVRAKGDHVDITNGPFLPGDWFLGGFYIVDCESLERAQEVATLIPDASLDGLGIEVRPIMFTTGATED